MLYDWTITVPAGTTEASPVKQELVLTKGLVSKLEIQMFAGCWATVECRLFHGGHQVYPSNLGGTFKTEDHTISFEQQYEIKAAPFSFLFQGFAPTSTEDHDVVVRVGMVESKALTQALKLIAGFERFFKALGVKL